MTSRLKEAVLPNGKKVYCLQKHDVAILHHEIQTYFDQGICVQPGDTIIDVGANIGLFMLEVYERCKGNANIYAFEPIPEVFQALENNAQRYGKNGHCHVFAAGLAQEPGQIAFTYYPNAPALSTAYPDEEADLQMVKQSVLENIIHWDNIPWMLQLIRKFPYAVQSALLDLALKQNLNTCQISCQMTTLSTVIAEQNLNTIDLLKIDAERSELDVLLGLRSEDWSKLQQMVAEIHDIDCRLDQTIALLKRHGLTQIATSQSPTVKNSNIYTVYALRPDQTTL